MLFWFSARRLALLVAGVLVIAIVSLRRTTYDDVLPNSYRLGVSGSHNGKGRPAYAPHENHGVSGNVISAIPRPSPSFLPHETLEQVQSKIHKLRAHWAPPSIDGHYPPYNKYGDADYDPNLWEGFEWDHDFYIRNGIKKLNKEKPYAAKLVPYLPYPDYNTAAWKGQWHGEYVPCEGARGMLLSESKDDWVMAYSALPDGFPKPAVGDSAVTGIDINHCFDRYNRLGPYGYGQTIRNRVQDWSRPKVTPNWTEVPWGRLQDQCLRFNQDRYEPGTREPVRLDYGLAATNVTLAKPYDGNVSSNTLNYHHRTAVLIRTWGSYQYTENDLQTIRSLITELTLLSGGEYQVFLFVHIRDNKLDLSDEELRQTLLKKHVPREFHSISILWNEKILEQWYPRVGDWQVYWHQFMPLQWFSKMLPQFEFVWNWEMDARYTGSHYHFLEQMSSFARATPRKYLWERNQRFYFPAAHGSYEQWLADTDASIEAAANNGSMQVVWGPQPYNRTHQIPLGPKPPHSMKTDDYEWGVNEEADLITLQPIWDPIHTEWVYKDKIFNFLPGIRPQFSPQDPLDKHFTHPEFANIPRRTFINTVARFSKRQLHAMHVENTKGRTMQAEMWPATVALHHGLKAVYAPHPIWTDRKWPGWYMDAVFNSDGRKRARWGAWQDSVYSHDREHNFAGWSWYYNADFPRTLYRRWLGWSAQAGSEARYPDHPLRVLGGSQFEDKGVKIELPTIAEGNLGLSTGEGNEVKIGGQGRMCLPPMLLHPVKKMLEPEGHMPSKLQDESDDGRLSWAWSWLMDKFD